ncbi:hypothetical protein Tco_1387487 [Tanacetum coccineum]
MDLRTCIIRLKCVKSQTSRQIKRGQDTKIPQSSGPPKKISDEDVHKELGDRMERVATTASSLEAKQDSDSGPKCQDTILGGVNAQTRFETTSKYSNDPPLSRVNTLGSREDIIHQFWETASASTTENEEMEITATIDGRVKTVTEASIRRHLKLEYFDGIPTLPNSKIFEQLALMGFIQNLLNKHQRHLLPHKRIYTAPTLTHKLFSNMKRLSKGYTGVDTPLFQTMLVQGQALQGEGSTITVESHHTPTSAPSTSQPPTTPPSMRTTHAAEEPTNMPHDSPLPRVQSLTSDEGSLTLNELMVLCTTLSKKVEGLESEFKETKQTYNTALTKLVRRMMKLEQTVKASQSRRRARVVLSDDEEDLEDPSKQGRKIAEIDQNPSISLILLEEEEPTELVEDHGSGEKGEKEISTADVPVSTAIAIPKISTAISER